jgi:hypothetical protein
MKLIIFEWFIWTVFKGKPRALQLFFTFDLAKKRGYINGWNPAYTGRQPFYSKRTFQ